MRFAVLVLGLGLGLAPTAHAQTYSLATSWTAIGQDLISDGSTLYVLDGTTGAITRFDVSGAVLGTFTAESDPIHPTMRLAGFDASGNLYVSHPDRELPSDSQGPDYGSSLDLYSPDGMVLAPRRSIRFAVHAVDRQGFMYALGRDEYNDTRFAKLSPQGDSLGGGGLGRYGDILGVSWDDRLFVRGAYSGGCQDFWIGWQDPTGFTGAVTGRSCGGSNDYVPRWATSDGNGGAFVTAYRTDGSGDGYLSVDRYGRGNDQRIARVDGASGDRIVSDSAGAFYLLNRGASLIQKWVPSSSTPNARSSWGGLKARWR